MENMRGDWRVTPAASSTTQMDMVHLVIGRPGVILLGEGNPQRVRGLLGQEKRRLSKVIGTAPLLRLRDRQRRGRAADPQAAHHADAAAAQPHRQGRQRAGQAAQRADGPPADAQGRDPEEHAAEHGRVPPAAAAADRPAYAATEPVRVRGRLTRVRAGQRRGRVDDDRAGEPGRAGRAGRRP